MKYVKLTVVLAAFLGQGAVPAVQIAESVPVDRVWAGHPVGFALLTAPPWQFVAYYDAAQSLVVAARNLEQTDCTKVVLAEKVGWDSHNYLTMTLDDAKRLHLSGNMHVDPLVYFMTERPLDIRSLKRVGKLVGSEEGRMSYPRFFRGPSGEFIYTYRDGSSGSGNQIYNVLDQDTGVWSRLLDQPLTDGQGQMNAYLEGPKLGPDGNYHVVWVWRDTSDCATNHDVSYMRSRDLRRWENVRGEALSLPVTIETPGTVVDPVPAGGGVINGNTKLGFDAENRPVVTYHKYDAAGNSQIYNARWADNNWAITQVTQWDSRWSFSGGGSIEFDVRVEPIRSEGAGALYQGWHHWLRGRELWRLDPDTLVAVEQVPRVPRDTPAALDTVESAFPGMQVRTATDLGESGEVDHRYLLRWETLGRNRDRPRDPPHPPASRLALYKVRL